MPTLSPSRSVVGKAMAAAMAPRARRSVSQWADAERRIVAQEAAEPGRWRSERTPYLRGPMDAYNDPEVVRISLMKGERMGGSELIRNIAGYIIDEHPGPVLWVYPTKDVAMEVNRKVLMPTFRGTPAIARHRTGRAWDERTTDLQFDRMSIAFRGSNAESGLEAMGYRDVIVDELDRCEANVLDRVLGRAAGFARRKLIEVSTPADEWSGDPDDRTQGIDRCFKQGDRRVLTVPCPHCGEYHERTFHQVRWIGDLSRPADDVEREAWFICPAGGCGEPIHGHHNQWQLERCVWRPEGWAVLKGGTLVAPDGRSFGPEQTLGGRYVPTGNSHASFHLHGLCTPFQRNPYGYVAREFVRNRGEVTREWLCRRLGCPWSNDGHKVERSELDVLRGSTVLGCGLSAVGSGLGGGAGGGAPAVRPTKREINWTLGTVPSEAAVLTAFADVQQSCIWCEVVAWDKACERCWLVEYLRLPRTVGDDLEALHDVLSVRDWPVVDLLTGELKRRQPVSVACVDSGHFTDEVYRFVRPRQGGRWRSVERTVEKTGPDGRKETVSVTRAVGAVVRASKGVPGNTVGGGRAWLGHYSTPENDVLGNRDGKPMVRPDAIRLLLINTWRYKEMLFDSIAAERARARRDAAIEGGAVGSSGPNGLANLDGMQKAGGHPAGATGAELVVDARPRRLLFPADTPKEYFDQLTAEQWKPKMVRGVRVREWSLRPGRRANHALDCRVGNMAIVAAERVAEQLAAMR